MRPAVQLTLLQEARSPSLLPHPPRPGGFLLAPPSRPTPCDPVYTPTQGDRCLTGVPLPGPVLLAADPRWAHSSCIIIGTMADHEAGGDRPAHSGREHFGTLLGKKIVPSYFSTIPAPFECILNCFGPFGHTSADRSTYSRPLSAQRPAQAQP